MPSQPAWAASMRVTSVRAKESAARMRSQSAIESPSTATVGGATGADEGFLKKLASKAGLTLSQVEAYNQVETIHLDGTVTLKSGERVPASSIGAGRG